MTEFSEEVKSNYKKIQSAFYSININGITILTGNNGSGKSLIRKQLPFLFKKEYNLSDIKDTKGMIKSTSMDARTTSNPEWGALSSCLHDTEWIATSMNTLSSIKSVLNACRDSNAKYVVIDEYEIGCSEETIMALAKFISDSINTLITENIIQGAMIITHSRTGLKQIKYDHFINIEGMTEDEWINREIKPTDLDKLDKNELFSFIQTQK
jgi:energy-coupling factor transporter ATP-binding protein EcfA2